MSCQETDTIQRILAKIGRAVDRHEKQCSNLEHSCWYGHRKLQNFTTSQFGTVPVGSALSYQQKIVQSDSDIDFNNPDEVIFPYYQLTEFTYTYNTVLNYADFNTFMGLHIDHNYPET